MSVTRYKPRQALQWGNNEFPGDLAEWKRRSSADNSQHIQRLREKLQSAKRDELTPLQAEVIHLYFDQGLSVTQIADIRGVNKSSVSRVLRRGLERLEHCLRYSL